jgi:hypothetical protein
MRKTPRADPPASTTALGDWYATLIVIRPRHLVLCVSEKSLLPIIVPAKPIGEIAPQLFIGILKMLQALRIPNEVIDRELAAMDEIHIAKTASRSILGSLRDFSIHLRYMPADLLTGSPLKPSLELAEVPCKPLNYMNPGEMTRALMLGESVRN